MILWIIATTLAYFVKGMTGFANTLVFETILSFGVNNIDITPVDLLLGYPANAVITWQERKYIKLKTIAFPTILMMLSSIPGMLFLKNADATVIKIIFGIVIVGLGIEMLVKELYPQIQGESKWILTIIGILAGMMTGLFGIGALLSAYMGRVTNDTHEFKGNLCAVFSIMNTYRVIIYIVLGIFTMESIKQALMVTPAMCIGLLLGIKCAKVMDERTVKRIVILALIISGLVLLTKNIAVLI